MASANIRQMKDVTTKGDNLKFVLQTGGSFRWFTSEIPENSNGRYVIEGGSISEVEKLDDKLCMSEPQSLTDFLNWGKQNYPADRYILVLWDHGGGFSLGYGSDSLNRRKDGDTMLVNEMIEAISASGMKFDVIGFDACLMQTLETAVAFEPYADYYIASEESEGGFGWFYTSSFGRLAEDPTAGIDVNRALTVSDLSVSDLTAEIGIELPKKWIERFQSKAEFKRMKSSQDQDSGTSDPENSGSTDNPGGSTTGSETGGEDESGKN